MRWPTWWTGSSERENEARKKQTEAESLINDARETVTSILNSTLPDEKQASKAIGSVSPSTSQLKAFTEPSTLVAAVILTAASLGVLRLYKSFLRRIPEATNIRPEFFRKRSVVGKVTSVGDGDNFRIYHTPGGWLAGWGWMPGRRVPVAKKDLKNQTIHIRLAGIDAPELAHFGRPSQPYAQDALDWLTSYLRGRRVRAYLHKADQYNRAVATVYIWKGIIRRDVGLQMLRAGLATVYEAKTGVEFGEGLEGKYRKAEWWAKTKRKGMWSTDKNSFESPREYKKRYGSGTPMDDSTRSP